MTDALCEGQEEWSALTLNFNQGYRQTDVFLLILLALILKCLLHLLVIINFDAWGNP